MCITSCYEHTYIDVPESELLQYEEGDTIAFELMDTLPEQTIDSFILDSTDFSYTDYIDFFGFARHEESYETRRYYFCKTGYNCCWRCWKIEKAHTSGFLIYWRNFDNQVFEGIVAGKAGSGFDIPDLEEKEINGITYDDIFVLEVDTTDLNSNALYKVLYNDHYGILEYYYKNGEIWKKVK